jgi:hypothetical protein
MDPNDPNTKFVGQLKTEVFFQNRQNEDGTNCVINRVAIT